MGEDADAAITHDAFFGGRLHLRQPARGHRAGTDAVLLAAAVPREFAGLVCDAGAGVGTAGLGIALTCPAARVVLLERDPDTLAFARANVAGNDLAERASVAACDLLVPAQRAEAGLEGAADAVVTNPPFHIAERVRVTADARRRDAHVIGEGGLAAWIKACLALLRPRGWLVVVHRADALADLLAALDGRAGAIAILPVHPRAGEPASRILLRAVKTSRAPLTLRPPLVLHGGKGFTAEADALSHGEAALRW